MTPCNLLNSQIYSLEQATAEMSDQLTTIQTNFNHLEEEVLRVCKLKLLPFFEQDFFHDIYFCYIILPIQSSKLRARVIQLEDDLSNTRQQHRDAAQEVNTIFVYSTSSSQITRIESKRDG